MRKYVGIIVAEVEEQDAILRIMNNISKINIYDLKIYKGTISGKNSLLVKSGVGKVNAARTVQILTDNFNLEYIINTGSAGSLNNDLNIGDIVIGEKLTQHDFDVTKFGREKGYIPDVGKFFYSNTSMVSKCMQLKPDNHKIIKGIIASGDIFCSDKKLKNKIKKDVNCDCVEMEGAAIAQVCSMNNIPFIVIRSISDTTDNNHHIEFTEYLTLASKNCASIISQLI